MVRRVAEEVFAARGRKVRYPVGTMIEVPRGALTAGEIAKTAEFFSFGTNDLTQTTFGLSRDDTGAVLAAYLEKEHLAGRSVRLDRPRGRRRAHEDRRPRTGAPRSPDLKLGICGEHGGDPSSVEFCHELGLDYVSCSPYRLPIARLAAAQAALKERVKAPAKAAPKGAVQRAAKVASKTAARRARPRARRPPPGTGSAPGG